ncbi:protein NLP7-like isoform X2 [Rhododendron vialii]|uniref:protein NLP7-like isoform X2 n=1 Tax=Rhododendron vialii TaxID=182163 RepID=UPI00265E6E1D|nr:protein NLP7-like isoform X2 [Rhododendron vialii]
MGMCTEYNSFYADAESGEEQLGLPGRVFLNKLPEYAPNVEHYTLKEYPQRDLALRCEILESWALPVFEQSSHTCVGVLEIADNLSWHDKKFLGHIHDIFQEFGPRCFDGHKHCKIQDGDENKALTTAFQELNMVYESVCKIHDLPLALTWVSCSCNHLLPKQSQFLVLNYCDKAYCNGYLSFWLRQFIQFSEVCHLRKGQVAGRILSFPNLLYCSDVKQFHIDEFSLVPFARHCKLGGWFTMCLQSSYTGDELYELELFLPKSTENDENILTKLRLILGTMEKNFKTFKLASGQGLGEALSVEVIDFQYGQRSHSIQKILATRFIPSLELVQDGGVMLQQVQQDQPSMDAINNGMYVISETQNYNFPCLDSFKNEKVTTQLDSSDRQSMDPSNRGQNVVIAERNILVVSSSKKGKRKTQDRKHKKAGVRIQVSLEEILKCSNMKRKYAARELKVSISTLKRVCRDFGIHRWPPRNIKKARSLPVENLGQTPQLNCDLPSNQASTSVAHIKPSFQVANMVTIRATCEKNTIKFRLSLSSRLVEMQQEVAKRLNLEGGTYYIKYKDEEDVLILIACDEDLQDCLHTSRSLGISSIAVQLELK